MANSDVKFLVKKFQIVTEKMETEIMELLFATHCILSMLNLGHSLYKGQLIAIDSTWTP